MASVTLRDVDVVYGLPGQSIGGMLASKRRPTSRPQLRTRKALTGITISIEQGERLALLGLNGAGKTTLLKVIAGIYAPVRGSVSTVGRIVPLLDIGLGMDGELTGRQNLTARGLFLGMSRREILDKEDEIIDFTGLRDQIDLPVSTYSAGMYVRLAFAVSTSVTPEILLVDEGLGAGDAAFQAKARARIADFLGRAGIVAFASHDHALLREYCTKAVVLHHGHVAFAGSLDDGVGYLRQLAARVVEES
jgi:ABC-type polysaccharide/polyol phosphate transport system ATPase subunit